MAPSSAAADCRHRGGAAAFHAALVAMFGYALYWQSRNPMPPITRARLSNSSDYITRWIFLTYWNNWFQFVGYLFILICDPLAAFARRSPMIVRVLRFRDLLFNSVVHPIGLFVQITFWAVYAVDRELIFPKSIEAWYPNWLNHITHSAMLPAAIGELLLQRHQLARRLVGMSTMLFFIGAYLVWILYLGLRVGFWVYPVLEVLPPVGRAAFIIVSTMLVVILYLLSEKINTTMWSKSKSSTSVGRRPQTRSTTNASGDARRKSKSKSN